jgi:integrase/recombinase XerD
MAELHRRHYRQRRRDERRKPKTQSAPTDWLTVEQFARIRAYIGSKSSSRAATNERIVILLVESGLRAQEAINLRMESLPCYHEHNVIDVKRGKGGWARSVLISEFLTEKIKSYVRPGWTKTEHFLQDEQGKKFSYRALYARIKRIGQAVGIPWLSPHKFRHTFATHLMAVSRNDFLVRRQLGHRFKDPTSVYVHISDEILKCEMEKFHNRLWGIQEQGFEEK